LSKAWRLAPARGEKVFDDLRRRPCYIHKFVSRSGCAVPAAQQDRLIKPQRIATSKLITRWTIAERCSTICLADDGILINRLGNGKKLVVDSDERLLSILVTLEECRAALASGGNGETAHLVSVAILDLRLKLNRITDAELRALCDEMSLDAATDKTRDPKLPQRGRPLLRLVK